MIKIKKSVFFLVVFLLSFSSFVFVVDSDPIPVWWDGNWSYRKAITLNSSQVSSNLTNFPVLINLTDTDLRDYAQDDGDDIAFTSSSNVQLNHEIELFDVATGHLVCWVNVTSLSHTADTVIYMYYNNSGAGNQQDVTNTWDGNYVAVWHMNDITTSTIKDSTSNSNDGTKKGANEPIEAAGKIGKAQDFDGSNDYVNCGGATTFRIAAGVSYTYSMWYTMGATGLSFKYPMNKGLGENAPPSTAWGLYFKYGYYRFMIQDATTSYDFMLGATGEEGTTKHIVAVVDRAANTAYGYLNTVQTSKDITGFTFTSDNYDMYVGAYRNNYAFVNGIIDEVRISNIARSAEWIKTEYNNMVNATDGGFFSVGISSTPPPAGRNIFPVNLSAWECPCCVDFCITVNDVDSAFMNITWYSNFSGVWSEVAHIYNVTDGTYCIAICDFDIYNYSYYWNVSVNDGINSVDYGYYLLVTDTYSNCNSSFLKESDIMDITIYMDMTLLFTLLLMIGWIVFTVLFFKNRFTKNSIILGFLQFCFAMPLTFVVGSLSTGFVLGYAITFIIPVLSILILVIGFFDGRRK